MLHRIWAPWRLQYVTGKRVRRCVFCRPPARHVIERSRHSFSVLNIYPYNAGHLMVIPKRHVRDLKQLSQNEMIDLFQLLTRTQNLLERAIKPQGFNIGVNLGKFSGAGIWGHLHIHIVPRWLGDTNFMPVIAGTKIISVSLKTLRETLHASAKKFPSSLTSYAGKHIKKI